MEFDTGADLEGPGSEVGVRAPFGRQFRDQLAARPDLDQAVPQLVLQLHHEPRLVDLRVQRVCGVEIRDGQPEGAATARRGLLRPGAAGRQAQSRRGGKRARADKQRTAGGQQCHGCSPCCGRRMRPAATLTRRDQRAATLQDG